MGYTGKRRRKIIKYEPVKRLDRSYAEQVREQWQREREQENEIAEKENYQVVSDVTLERVRRFREIDKEKERERCFREKTKLLNHKGQNDKIPDNWRNFIGLFHSKAKMRKILGVSEPLILENPSTKQFYEKLPDRESVKPFPENWKEITKDANTKEKFRLLLGFSANHFYKKLAENAEAKAIYQELPSFYADREVKKLNEIKRATAALNAAKKRPEYHIFKAWMESQGLTVYDLLSKTLINKVAFTNLGKKRLSLETLSEIKHAFPSCPVREIYLEQQTPEFQKFFPEIELIG